MRRLVLLVALLGGCELAVSTKGLDGGCPPLAGTSMVKVSTPTGSYCVDATEVTNAQYTQFLASGAGFVTVPDGCVATTPMTPVDNWPPAPGSDHFPVAEVTWCQAYAYCQSVGKRLCGQIGGGALAQTVSTKPELSQWLYACSAGGGQPYPYGNAYDMNACGGMDVKSIVAQVGTQPGCIGGFPGLYDMSGNLWEWTDTCASTAPGAFCHALGGGFDSTQSDLLCLGERNWTRTAGAANIGLRCCFDL